MAVIAKQEDDSKQDGLILTADGMSLKKSLARSLRMQKLRALMLILPLLAFILITFIAPITDMLFRSVENQIVRETLPRTLNELQYWDLSQKKAPGETVFHALYDDLEIAIERKVHTRLGTRLNYEQTGFSSLFRRTGRNLDAIGKIWQKQFEEFDPFWKKGENWANLLMTSDWINNAKEWEKTSDHLQPPFVLKPELVNLLPKTTEAYSAFARYVQLEENEALYKKDPWPGIYIKLYQDLISEPDLSALSGMGADELRSTAQMVSTFETISFKDGFLEIDKDWGEIDIWRTIQVYASSYTSGYFLNAIDMQNGPDGPELRPENERIYIILFMRTLYMSLIITFFCIILGYPVAWLLVNIPTRKSNLLMILVLLPFWTSLLVRTSAWKVMLQQQGVINDILVWLGLVDDAARLVMINNQLGTIIAMTHILLPFMILPMYSVMQTIPPSYLRAAKSLGATNWTAFWRVYFPQTIPGIGAGSILVFILSIGYYITPAIVGGTSGVFISDRIAYHISSSLNWGLGAALGTILLGVVILLYFAYDKAVGIDNVKLGG
ncbi:MAG: ABC transporter permease [Aestuariivita sp.]|nr:ABC transporter permease [Aestuariivita sp.]